MKIKTNYSLTTLNTFHIAVVADYYVEIKTEEELVNLAKDNLLAENRRLILGGGSNILFVQDFRGIVIHPKFSGIEQLNEDESSVVIKVGSGIVWDDFVSYAVKNNLGGIENLSNIPGNVGASPIQNIGAYGVEVKQTIESVEGFYLSKNEFSKISAHDCHFGYRTSIFKQNLKNDFLITNVLFRLSKPPHVLTTKYDIVEEELRKYSETSISVLREVISNIRNSKLPNTELTGNAGSFFKNPEVSHEFATELKGNYPDIPVYPTEKNGVKLSAAWLIDKAKCKGIRIGNAGTYEKQPLVIINFGNATGQNIIDIASHIQEKVRTKFGVRLEPEVNII